MTIKIPNVIATHVRKVASLAQITAKSKAYGLGVYNGVPYLNVGSGAQSFAQLANDPLTNSGTLASVAGLTVAESSFNGLLHQTVFTLAAMPLTLLDAAQGGGQLIYTFPAGAITILGATGSVAETTTSAILTTLNGGKTYNWGLGTTTQANGTLATTEQNVLPSANGTSSATINVAGAVSPSVRTAAPANFDGHSVATPLYFNVGVATGTDIDADATTTWSGTLTVSWLFNGDV